MCGKLSRVFIDCMVSPKNYFSCHVFFQECKIYFLFYYHSIRLPWCNHVDVIDRATKIWIHHRSVCATDLQSNTPSLRFHNLTTDFVPMTIFSIRVHYPPEERKSPSSSSLSKNILFVLIYEKWPTFISSTRKSWDVDKTCEASIVNSQSVVANLLKYKTLPTQRATSSHSSDWNNGTHLVECKHGKMY